MNPCECKVHASVLFVARLFVVLITAPLALALVTSGLEGLFTGPYSAHRLVAVFCLLVGGSMLTVIWWTIR